MQILKQYLIQIHRIKLKDYINSALILPDIYLGKECEKDIQSKNKNFLVFSDGYINELDETQILIDVILTKSEIQKLHQCGEMYYADFPLPITRIKKIYVQDKIVQKHILATIETSENGMLPKTLFDIYNTKEKKLFLKKEYQSLNDDVKSDDYTNSIKLFDKRMGMFSFMKNTNLYYADNQKIVSNYNSKYFTIHKLLENQDYHELNMIENNPILKEILYSNKLLDKDILISIAETIEDNETKELFLGYLKPTGGRSIIKEFAKNGQILYYLIGLIWRFKQKDDSNKLDNLKSDIQDLIPYEEAELSLAILGLYYGYSKLRSHEEIIINDAVFKAIFGTEFNIKFEMDTKLDYITVESLYLLCFSKKDKKGFEFEYLNYPVKPKVKKIQIDEKLKIWYNITTEEHFDKNYITIKELSFKDVVLNKLQSYPNDIKLGIHHIFSYFYKYYKNENQESLFGNLDTLNCSKSTFINAVENQKDEKKQKELLKLFEADGK